MCTASIFALDDITLVLSFRLFLFICLNNKHMIKYFCVQEEDSTGQRGRKDDDIERKTDNKYMR